VGGGGRFLSFDFGKSSQDWRGKRSASTVLSVVNDTAGLDSSLEGTILQRICVQMAILLLWLLDTL